MQLKIKKIIKKETDSLKLFWFCQIYVLSILIISTTKRDSEHTNCQYFLARMSPFMTIFAKQWVFKTSVFVHNMTWKGIETLHDFSFKLRTDQGRKLKGSLSTSVLCGRRLMWRPFSLISKLQLSKSWLFLKILCACEQFTVRCVKTSLHHRTSLCICVFFY